MAVIKSGASTDQLSVDATSKAARVTQYDSTGLDLSIARNTYSAASGDIIIAGSPTDTLVINGSATKTIKITKIGFNATQTTAGRTSVSLLRRSSADTGGSTTVGVAVPHDSTNPAATAVVSYYIGNPTLGTLVGNLRGEKVFIPAPATAADDNRTIWNVGNEGQPIVLRGTSEILAINFGGVTVTGNSCRFFVEWQEY